MINELRSLIKHKATIGNRPLKTRPQIVYCHSCQEK